MAFQIRPDRAHDSSAPISSAFREFSIYSLPELAGPAVATHLNSGFPKPLNGTLLPQSGAALPGSATRTSPRPIPQAWFAPTGAASQSNQLPPVADLLRLGSRLFTSPRIPLDRPKAAARGVRVLHGRRDGHPLHCPPRRGPGTLPYLPCKSSPERAGRGVGQRCLRGDRLLYEEWIVQQILVDGCM